MREKKNHPFRTEFRVGLAVTGLISMLLMGGAASAVEFWVVGDANHTVTWGEIITIDIVMTNSSMTGVHGIGASVHGYDPEDAVFLRGSAVTTYLNQICVAPGLCFGGLQNLAGPELVESSIGDHGPRVQFALSASAGSVVGPPGVDQGLDNATQTTMFSLTFLIRRPCSNFLIDTSYPGDGVISASGERVQAVGATVTTAICPEPGTAVLMGVGFAGLSATGSKRRDQRARS